MRGELDWIVMKCLEKDRNRRYETANGFAADVQRYLNDEPVQACPPSAWYRFRKFARRNKAGRWRRRSSVAFAVAVALGRSWPACDRGQARGEARRRTAGRRRAAGQALDRERADAYFHRITVAHRELSADNLARPC